MSSNSLLSGIAEIDFAKFQRIVNHLAPVVTKSPPFTHSVPLMRSLHWLPVKYRVHFKICLLTYKALHEEQPVYLQSLIATSLPPCSLRSNRGITLSVPRIKTKTGARAFSSCALSLWSNLPLSVRSATSVATFRKRLKTYLFDLAFPHRHVIEWLQQLRIWTPIWLLRHWVWLCWGYWRYRNFISLIEWSPSLISARLR